MVKRFILLFVFCLLTNIHAENPTPFKDWLEKNKVCHIKKKKTETFFEFLKRRREERMKQKKKMEQLLCVFETGGKDPDYSNITIFNDGPNDIKQITYGRTQVTEYGHLPKLISNYCERGGLYSTALKKYVGKIGKGSSLHNDNELINLLKMAGQDPQMMACQDEIFEEKYWGPAKKWFDDNGFKEELSMMVIYDSFTHSGGMLSFLRERFSEPVPAKGGNEKKWIKEYVDVRHNWLAGHRRPILRKTIYRTKVFKELIKDDNWGMDKKFIAQGFPFLGDKGNFDTIVLPKEDSLNQFYSPTDPLGWFSFPCEIRLIDGSFLMNSLGDPRPDYVCHKDLTKRLEKCYAEVFSSLKEDRFKKEGWDFFGGSFDEKVNPLGTSLSINPFNPEVLSPEGINIFEKYGFLNLGRATGVDADYSTFIAFIPKNISKDSYYDKNGLPKNIVEN